MPLYLGNVIINKLLPQNINNTTLKINLPL